MSTNNNSTNNNISPRGRPPPSTSANNDNNTSRRSSRGPPPPPPPPPPLPGTSRSSSPSSAGLHRALEALTRATPPGSPSVPPGLYTRRNSSAYRSPLPVLGSSRGRSNSVQPALVAAARAGRVVGARHNSNPGGVSSAAVQRSIAATEPVFPPPGMRPLVSRPDFVTGKQGQAQAARPAPIAGPRMRSTEARAPRPPHMTGPQPQAPDHPTNASRAQDHDTPKITGEWPSSPPQHHVATTQPTVPAPSRAQRAGSSATQAAPSGNVTRPTLRPSQPALQNALSYAATWNANHTLARPNPPTLLVNVGPAEGVDRRSSRILPDELPDELPDTAPNDLTALRQALRVPSSVGPAEGFNRRSSMALQGVLLGTARTDQIDRMIDNGVQRAQNWHDQDDSDEDASRDARAHRDLPQRRPSTIHWSHHIESSDDDSEVDTHDGLPPFHATANDKAESEHHSQDSEEDLQGARRPPKGPSPEGQTRSARWAIKGFCFLTLLLFILVSPFLLGFCMFYQRPDLVIQQSPSDTNSTDLQAGADSIVRLALNLSQNIEDSVYEFDRAVFAPCAAFWLHCELGGSRDSLFWEPYKRLSSGIDESSRGWSQEQPCLIIAGCPDQTAASDPSAFEVFQQLSDQHLWPLTQIYISIQQEVAKIEPVVPRLHKNASIEGEAIRKLMLIEEAHWAQVEASTWPSLYYFATSVYRPTVALHESDLADREQYPLLLRLALFVTQRVWDNFWTAILPETFPVSLRRRHLHIAAALGEASRVTSGAVAEIQAKGKECTQQLARVEKHLQQELYYLSGQQAPPLWVEWMRDYLEPVCVWAEGKGRVVDESQQRVDLRAIRKSLAHVDQAVSRVLQAQGSMTGWRSLVGPPSVGDKEHAGRKMLVGRVEEVAKRAEEWKEGLPER